MNRRRHARWFSFVQALVMAFSPLPMQAFAAETEETRNRFDKTTVTSE